MIDSLLDVRNCHNKPLRKASFKKGYNSKQIKQNKYLTWALAGFFSKNHLNWEKAFETLWDEQDLYLSLYHSNISPFKKVDNRYFVGGDLVSSKNTRVIQVERGKIK